jgi:hypothetical protein
MDCNEMEPIGADDVIVPERVIPAVNALSLCEMLEYR